MKLRQPPSSFTGDVRSYLEDVCRAINSIPQMSYFSGTNPILSGITGVAANIVVNVGVLSNVSRIWVHDGSAVIPDRTSWRTVA